MVGTENFTIPGPKEDGGLSIVFMRYKFNVPISAGPTKERLSLLFLHGVSTHKELWLPTIERLEHLQRTASNNAFAIVEAWAMDAQNHGEAAVANEKAFASRDGGLSGYEWSRALRAFLETDLIGGTSVVAIGHSAGACIPILATVGLPIDRLPFSSLILVEPPMMSPEIFAKIDPNTPIIAAFEMTKTRKDIWPSREAARQWLAKRIPCKLWDPRILQLYVDHALRDLPTATYPDRHEGVTLSCTRVQEAAGYVRHQEAFATLHRLKDLCAVMPVHCIFGERLDFVPEEIQNTITDASAGRKMATITKIADAGHLVVQENPDGVAVALFGALHYGIPKKAFSSKL